METKILENIRNGLVEKQKDLSDWVRKSPSSKKALLLGPAQENAVENHLQTIKNCIRRAEEGTLGVCKICLETVESDLLEVDYTANICLTHYSPEEMKRLENDLELAQTIQKTLLPQEVPDFPGIDISAFSSPAQIIGGDYFDFFRLGNGDYAFAIADVAGHGVSAGMHMASVQAMLRSIVLMSDSPAEIMKRLHRLFTHNIRFTTFVSLFIAAYNPSMKTLTYANAGHTPPFLLGKLRNGSELVHWLHPTGAAIGLIEEAEFHEKTIDLGMGDLLVMYTDGVTEAINQQNEQFGSDRLVNIVEPLRECPPADVVREIRLGLHRFNGDHPHEDDITLVTVRIQ